MFFVSSNSTGLALSSKITTVEHKHNNKRHIFCNKIKYKMIVMTI